MSFDLVIKGGTVYDGTGGAPVAADVVIVGDRIARVGPADSVTEEADQVVDATGLAVAPGFVNVLSHAYVSVLQDGRSLADLKQGVTTEIFGEGSSMGPWTPEMRDRFVERLDDDLDVPWTRLSEYLAHVEKRGSAQNVASFIGATTMRVYGVGYENRRATEAELDIMRGLVAEEMADGALGIASALIYAPAFFADTEELIALCAATAPYDGKYISHMRSEGEALLESLDELLRISREAGVPAEVYHLKAVGRDNWPKMDQAIARIEAARDRGEPITADMYLYTAGGTSLSATIPPWFHDGGIEKLVERLGDPVARKEAAAAIESSTEGWENLYQGCGGGDGILVLAAKAEEHRQYVGKTVTEIAAAMGVSPIEAIFDLVRVNGYDTGAAYFMISEENVRRQVQLPWVSFGSDAASPVAEGKTLGSPAHPRTYGNFARLLGHYVRDEGLVPLEEAIRRLSNLPATTLGLADRGRLAEGAFADVVVFDPATISDRATYDNPHQYAVGMRDVIVNGTVTLRNGEFAGSFGGRALAGHGKR
jgi:N-acyl-D-amino-acid deacylase